MDDMQALIEGLEPYKTADSKEKLIIIRLQSISYTSTLRGFAELTRIKLEAVEISKELKDLPDFMGQILGIGQYLEKIMRTDELNSGAESQLNILHNEGRKQLSTALELAEIAKRKLEAIELSEELKDLPYYMERILKAGRETNAVIEIMTTQVKSDSST